METRKAKKLAEVYLELRRTMDIDFTEERLQALQETVDAVSGLNFGAVLRLN